MGVEGERVGVGVGVGVRGGVGVLSQLCGSQTGAQGRGRVAQSTEGRRLPWGEEYFILTISFDFHFFLTN